MRPSLSSNSFSCVVMLTRMPALAAASSAYNSLARMRHIHGASDKIHGGKSYVQTGPKGPQHGTCFILQQLPMLDARSFRCSLSWLVRLATRHRAQGPTHCARKLMDLIVDHSASGKLEGDARSVAPLLAQMIAAGAPRAPKSRAALFNALLEAPTPESLLLFVRELVRTGHPFPAACWNPINNSSRAKIPSQGRLRPTRAWPVPPDHRRRSRRVCNQA